jgi:hypothetical protein
MILIIVLLIFLLLGNWLFSELFAFLPLHIFEGVSYGFSWVILAGLLALGSWFFGD